MHIFFAGISVIIVVMLMIPAVFGFQNFTQWGGMYTDSWCFAELFEMNPALHPTSRSQVLTIGKDDGTRVVLYNPQYNEQTCAARARTECGRTTKDGWVVNWVRPRFKAAYFMGYSNACDLPLSASSPWFIHVAS